MPLIMLTAILVRLLTKESVILYERLIGCRSRIFVGYKFRVPVGCGLLASNVAEALSRTELDQLPRFLNVVRLIGPRPRAAAESYDYFAQAPECLRARPGLIRIWQNDVPNQQAELAVDRCYVSTWSLRLDLALLLAAIDGRMLSAFSFGPGADWEIARRARSRTGGDDAMSDEGLQRPSRGTS